MDERGRDGPAAPAVGAAGRGGTAPLASGMLNRDDPAAAQRGASPWTAREAGMDDTPPTDGSEPVNGQFAATPPAVEHRLRRLEDAVAHLQDTRALEDRVVERVAERVVPAPHPVQDAAGVVIEASRRLLPVTMTTVEKPAPPRGRASSVRRPWLFFDMLAEARAIGRMFVDPRYHLSWRTRFFAVGLAAMIFTSGFWVPFTSLPFVGSVLDKGLDLVLAFALFKLLGHEARHYRETSPDLPPSLRL